MSQRVVLLGASDRSDRYAYRTFHCLLKHGHEVIPVHPTLEEIEGTPVLPDLSQVEGLVDTLTLYVRPSISESLSADIIALKPARVLFNPGTESTVLQEALDAAGIPWKEACTFILLEGGRF